MFYFDVERTDTQKYCARIAVEADTIEEAEALVEEITSGDMEESGIDPYSRNGYENTPCGGDNPEDIELFLSSDGRITLTKLKSWRR